MLPSSSVSSSAFAVLLLALGACGGVPNGPNTSHQGAPVSTVTPTAANSGQQTRGLSPAEFGAVTEEKFGQKIYDPFRGLEKGEDPAVVEWTRLQNKRTRDAIDGAGNREVLKKKLGAILEIGSVQVPTVRMKAGKSIYFYTKREGKQSQPVLYVREGDWRKAPRDNRQASPEEAEESRDNRQASPEEAEEFGMIGLLHPAMGTEEGVARALVDVSSMGGVGDKKVPVSLDWWVPSDDGSLLAWGASKNGSEESTLHLCNVATGVDLKDEIPYTRHASIAWEPGNKAFYYTRYPVPGSVPDGDEKYFRKIYRHELGAAWKKDVLVFGEGRAKTDSPSVDLSPDGRYLVVGVHQGWSKSEIYLKDLKTKGAEFVEVTSGKENYYEPFFAYGKLWLRTNDEASTFRVVEVSYAKPKEWVTRVKHDIDTLTNVSPTKSGFVLEYLHNASSRLALYPKDVLISPAAAMAKTRTPPAQAPSVAIPLPGVGTVSTEGHELSDEFFYSFVSYARPATIFAQSSVKLAAATKFSDPKNERAHETPKADEFEAVGKSANLGDIRVEQTTATSKDGMEIPLFLVGKESVLKGPRKNIPVVLYGYGGFNISQTPQFSPRALIVAQSGGIWAHAILRGGGEFGESWHEAGKRHKKQNVFNDFIGCAESLIRRGLTSPDRLAIMGGSNGGLLVAAAAIQRPDLFRVGASMVPLTDMLRYHLFRIGKLWIPEYGSADEEADFNTLFKYSPYHNVKANTRYPSMLFATAESDTRVDPMHAKKMAARMQSAQADASRRILLRVETNAGHGAGKPVEKVADELADTFGFVFSEIGL